MFTAADCRALFYWSIVVIYQAVNRSSVPLGESCRLAVIQDGWKWLFLFMILFSERTRKGNDSQVSSESQLSVIRVSSKIVPMFFPVCTHMQLLFLLTGSLSVVSMSQSNVEIWLCNLGSRVHFLNHLTYKYLCCKKTRSTWGLHTHNSLLVWT